jgi:hypothetical protein
MLAFAADGIVGGFVGSTLGVLIRHIVQSAWEDGGLGSLGPGVSGRTWPALVPADRQLETVARLAAFGAAWLLGGAVGGLALWRISNAIPFRPSRALVAAVGFLAALAVSTVYALWRVAMPNP